MLAYLLSFLGRYNLAVMWLPRRWNQGKAHPQWLFQCFAHGCTWIKYSRFIFLLITEYIQHHSKELCLLKAKVWVYFTQLIKHNFLFGKEPIRATWLSPTVAFYDLNLFSWLCIEVVILLEENWNWSLLVLKSLIFTLSKTHYLCMFCKNLWVAMWGLDLRLSLHFLDDHDMGFIQG